MQISKERSQLEFVALMAFLMSVVALAIDALLPALDVIGVHINTKVANDNQLLITMIFLGLGIGPLLFGPISDSLGRKPIVYMGFAVFILASFICIYAENLEMMIFGRVLQGVGLSAPRTIAIAIIRDMYTGDYMARIMSFVTLVFLLVPIVAPALGKFLLDRYDWQTIFYVQIVYSLVVTLWFWLRQPETLAKEDRIPFKSEIFKAGFKEVLQHKKAIGYTIIQGFITGTFMVYLSSSQQIFQEQYGLKEEFPYIFSGLALSFGLSMILNANLVIKHGMERLVKISLYGFLVVSAVYVLLYHSSDNPSVEVLLIFFAAQFFCIGFLFGNLRSLAMVPLGHIAGIAAAITGFIATLMAVPLSIYIGRFIDQTALPLFVGFSICAIISMVILWWINRTKD